MRPVEGISDDLLKRIRSVAQTLAERALPTDVEPEFDYVGELMDVIEEWLLTFDEEFLEKQLPVWAGQDTEEG